jgi:micrococcal nuclease
MKEKLFYPLLGVATFLLLLVFSQGLSFDQITINKDSVQNSEKSQTGQESSEEKSQTTVLVTKVVDGDTIEVEGGQKVRYIGIDTPETVDPRQAVQCYGQDASNKNKQLVEGKRVTLEKDVSETDRYGRLLRYVYVDGVFVNEYLVKEGFAKASSYPPDIKYQEKFTQAENSARDGQKGLWGSCKLTSGQVQSSTNYNITPLVGGSSCLIKGNISSSGEKIYHLPTGQYYDRTSIDESKGERWFCSEDEARNSGWRASKV